MKRLLAICIFCILFCNTITAFGAEDNSEGADRVKLAVQMFNFSAGGDWGQIKSMEELETLLTRIYDAGYDGVEWTSYQLKSKFMDMEGLKIIMEGLGLETCGLQFDLSSMKRLEEDAAKAVENCLMLDTEYLILSYTGPESFGIKAGEGEYTPGQIDEWAENVNNVLDVMKKAAEGTDIKILYHNHNTEFYTGSSGRFANDLFLADGKETDVYWACKGLDGWLSTTMDYINSNIDSIYIFHVKDGIDGSVEGGDICGWGMGTYDIQSIVDAARNSDTIQWIVVENDAPISSGIEDAELSAKYARNIDFLRNSGENDCKK